jgi:hypothetical protein
MAEQSATSLFGWCSLVNDNNLGSLSEEERTTKETLDDTFDKAALQAVHAQQPVSRCCATPSYLWIEY